MKKTLKLFITALSLFICTYASGQIVIEMEKDGGVYKIPCHVNGLRLKLIFDTGASSVCISGAIADMMLENGYLRKEDIKGSGQTVVADGRIVDNTIINIKELLLGGVTLSNVEAVVIHQQSAPLLLGQSAIQKLGLVSIHENQLIINQYSNSPVAAQNTLTEQEVDEYFRLAADAWSNGAHELAAEYYKSLYNQQELSSYGKYLYAECLRLTKNYLGSISIYKEIIPDINRFDQNTQSWVYYGIQRCYAGIGEYNSAIQYGQLALRKTTFADDHREGIIYRIASAHKELGDAYSGLIDITSEIQKYLSYMEVRATDCWDKGYKDPYLAKLYFDAYLITPTPSDEDKYIIISAAWGNARAIETAKKLYLTYTTKPTNYVY